MKHVEIKWNLLKIMTSRGIRFSNKLKERLEDEGVTLSVQHVNKLVSRCPERLSIKVLKGLCAVLDCQPGDLIKAEIGPHQAEADVAHREKKPESSRRVAGK